MNVVLIGMKHCGKSTLGAALARHWQCPFHDVDSLIEATYECDAGERLTVREILLARGERGFHELEGQVVCQLYLRGAQRPEREVIALGGRTATHASNAQLLGDLGVMVLLEVPPEELFARIAANGLPPFLQGDHPYDHFFAVYQQRLPLYRRLAALTVPVGGLSREAAAATLIYRLEVYEHAGK